VASVLARVDSLASEVGTVGGFGEVFGGNDDLRELAIEAAQDGVLTGNIFCHEFVLEFVPDFIPEFVLEFVFESFLDSVLNSVLRFGFEKR
jgi:hypothetical protein